MTEDSLRGKTNEELQAVLAELKVQVAKLLKP
jgi:ribosomal protein L29